MQSLTQFDVSDDAENGARERAGFGYRLFRALLTNSLVRRNREKVLMLPVDGDQHTNFEVGLSQVRTGEPRSARPTVNSPLQLGCAEPAGTSVYIPHGGFGMAESLFAICTSA